MSHSVCGLSMRLSWLEVSSVHSAARSWPLVAWISFWAFILYVLLPSWVGPCLIVGFSFSNPFFTPFASRLALLPCHSITHAMLFFDSCLLGLFWAYYMFSFCLILVAQYYHWASIHVVLGFLGPSHYFQVSLAHFISLGILCPFQFFIPMLSLLGFPDPNYHIIYFWGL